ncbi:MAG: cytochrome c-type biogenesis protein CcmH [Acidobacteria bacterium]|nr:cytochrome c-type biogenesis protein CcmH [Acidobacteriota bacterium]
MRTASAAAALLLSAAACFCFGQQERVRALEEKLMAPCCWSESVAVHRSAVAAEMRADIASMVVAGKSDREILDHYRSIYGTRILLEPVGAKRIWVYTIPVAASLAGIWLVIWVIRRMLKPPQAASAA